MTILSWTQRVCTHHMQSKLFGTKNPLWNLQTHHIFILHRTWFVCTVYVCVRVLTFTSQHETASHAHGLNLNKYMRRDSWVKPCPWRRVTLRPVHTQLAITPNLIFWIGTSSFWFDGIQLFLLTIATISRIATKALRSVGCRVYASALRQYEHHENS